MTRLRVPADGPPWLTDYTRSIEQALNSLESGGSGGGSTALLASIVDEKAAGTSGGAATHGSYATRTLNTVAFDPDGIVTLSGNTFSSSVACGVTWSAPLIAGSVALHKTRLVRVSDSAVIEYGSVERSQSSTSNRSTGSARIEAGVAYRIEQYPLIFAGSATFGDALGTDPEIYTTVNLWR